MDWVGVLLIIVCGLFLSGFFSGAETGLYGLDRLRLQLGVRRRDPAALRLARVLQDEQTALSVTLVGTNLANYLTTLAVSFLLAELLGFSETRAELYTVATLTPIVFVIGEMVPKTLFQLHPDRLMARSSRLLSIADRIFRFTGVVWILTGLSRWMNRLVGVRRTPGEAFEPKRRFAHLLHESIAGDPHSPDQSALIDRVCRLSDTPLHAVMVPRNRVRMIAANAERRELLRLARRTSHTAIPIYDTSARRITGLIKVEELLSSDRWVTVGEKAHPIMALRPHESVAAAIPKLRLSGQRMAMITDRGGQLVGIVTLKDLLSEVVGEIADEM